MQAKRLTPVFNVSSMQDSFEWFRNFGWEKGWEWGEPVSFGGVCAGDCEIFLCLDGHVFRVSCTTGG